MRELFEHTAIPGQLEALDIRKPLEWAEATLRRTAFDPFAAAFDQGDAVNYFYEPFLEAYDPDLRAQLGVWYTPREIIRYQVARVDRLLRDELGVADGLAGDEVIVLDPATGTGGYVLEVLRVIDATLAATRGATRALDLRQAATQRVFGFEILPAPFVIAHLQVAALLADRGAALPAKQRAGIFLTNALTGWKAEDYVQRTLDGFPNLKREAELSGQVKQDKHILVILGNPPYYKFAGVAEEEERDLLKPYYLGLDERFGIQPRSINDLYVRFLRLAEHQIADETGKGIVSLITNGAWLDGLSNTIMREQMLKAFDMIWIDNLNGDKFRTGKRTPWGTTDQSIFTTDHDPRGIQIGTAITTMLRREVHGKPAVHWRQFWGRADEKREQLLNSLANADRSPFTEIEPSEVTRFTFRPGTTESDYRDWPALDELFVQQFPGVLTSRDPDLVSIDREPLAERMQRYFDPAVGLDQLEQTAPTLTKSTNRYDAKATRQKLLETSGFREDHIIRASYRPLDDRWLYWEDTTKLLDEKRADFMTHVFQGNLYLEAIRHQRKSNQFDHGVVLSHFMDYNFADGGARCFPLYERKPGSMFAETKPNFQDDVLEQLTAAYGASTDLPELLFFHIASMLNDPAYREENAGAIEQDWPRIPLPATRAQLQASAALGRRVSDLLRPDIPFTAPPELRALAVPARMDGAQLTEDDLTVTVRYGGIGRYDPASERLWWNDRAFWDHVPPSVWAFTIGGYPVIKKWLDYRHIEKLRRPLRLDEVYYVSAMVRRIAALLALGPDLDANYEAVKAHTLTLNLARVPGFTQ